MQGSTIPNLSSCLCLNTKPIWLATYNYYTLMALFPSRSHFFALCSRLGMGQQCIKGRRIIWRKSGNDSSSKFTLHSLVFLNCRLILPFNHMVGYLNCSKTPQVRLNMNEKKPSKSQFNFPTLLGPCSMLKKLSKKNS